LKGYRGMSWFWYLIAPGFSLGLTAALLVGHQALLQ
jgi:hypothetical protein